MTAPAPLTPANQPAECPRCGSDDPRTRFDVEGGSYYASEVIVCDDPWHPYLYQQANQPADGTDPAAITDEDLVKWEDQWRRDAKPPPVLRLIAALRASRAEVERLRGEAREDYARAELAEASLLPLRDELSRLRAMADDLAVALHQCAAFLPLFLSEHGEEGRKLQRALAVDAQVQAALGAYCMATETRRQALNNRTVKSEA